MELVIEKAGPNFFDLLRQAAALRFDGLTETVAKTFLKHLTATYWRLASNLTVSQTVIDKYPCFSNTTEMLRGLLTAVTVEKTRTGHTVGIDHDRLLAVRLPSNLALLLEYGHPDGIPELPAWRLTEQWMKAQGFDKTTREFVRDLR